MQTYLVLVPSLQAPGYAAHNIQADAPPTIVSDQGLTFTIGGVTQAPSPFPQWCACELQS